MLYCKYPIHPHALTIFLTTLKYRIHSGIRYFCFFYINFIYIYYINAREDYTLPLKPLRPCNYPGCNQLSRDSRCNEHAELQRIQAQKRLAENRPSYHSWYNSPRWRHARLLFLKDNPLCVYCKIEGRLTPAQIVDHIVSHKGDYGLFWSKDNWQSLCKACHDKKID
jgi:5-methylcytosine-specific restriction protein A